MTADSFRAEPSDVEFQIQWYPNVEDYAAPIEFALVLPGDCPFGDQCTVSRWDLPDGSMRFEHIFTRDSFILTAEARAKITGLEDSPLQAWLTEVHQRGKP